MSFEKGIVDDGDPDQSNQLPSSQPAEDERVRELLRFTQKVAARMCERVDGDECAFFVKDVDNFCPRCHAQALLNDDLTDWRVPLGLLPAQPAQQDDGWVTFGRIKTDIESETETFERIPVQPAASTPTLTNDATRKDAPEEVLIEPELPCPFCGGLEIVNCYDDGLYWKRCRTCGATGPETTKYSGAEGEPFTDWNSRTAASTEAQDEKE